MATKTSQGQNSQGGPVWLSGTRTKSEELQSNFFYQESVPTDSIITSQICCSPPYRKLLSLFLCCMAILTLNLYGLQFKRFIKEIELLIVIIPMKEKEYIRPNLSSSGLIQLWLQVCESSEEQSRTILEG